MAITSLLDSLKKTVARAESSLRDAEEIIALGEDAQIDMTSHKIEAERLKTQIALLNEAIKKRTEAGEQG